MMYEKMATPISKMTEVVTLSMFDFGLISPKPTVDRDVKAKYYIRATFSPLLLEGIV